MTGQSYFYEDVGMEIDYFLTVYKCELSME